MESMKGFLLHLTEADHRDHQVRAWMTQIVGLTRDCGGNIELYLQYVAGDESGNKGAVLGFLLSIPQFLRTVWVRHQIATRIQELKVRVRDVAERRLRYDVTIPKVDPYQDHTVDDRPAPQPGSQDEEVELRRRELLHRCCSTKPASIVLEEGTDQILELLLEKGEDGTTQPRPASVIFITQSNKASPPGVAKSVYEHPSLVSSFKHKALADLKEMDPVGNIIPIILLDKISDMLGKNLDALKRENFIVVVDNVWYSSCPSHAELVDNMVTLFCSDYSGILIVSTPKDLEFCLKQQSLILSKKQKQQSSTLSKKQKQQSPEVKIQTVDLVKCFEDRVSSALANCNNVPKAREICLEIGIDDAFTLQMFFRLIYASPNRPEREMDNLLQDLKKNKSNTAKVMLRSCYKDLPSNHKNCLLYLSIFPEGHKIRKTSLLRRWLAEGLVSRRSRMRLKGASMDGEAEHIFDALVTRGFLDPVESSTAGKIKTFTVPIPVHKFIVAALSYMGNPCMPPELAHRLSINNGVDVELLEVPPSDRPFHDVLTLLEQITASVPWQLLKVLDLEGCKGLKKKKHLKPICQMLLLKYLSLRDTDVNKLPKQIEKLQCLETLDIRQTRVQTLSTNQVNFPKLKYFLAGHRESPSNRFSKYKDPFTALRLPRGIRRIKKLQVLSYVDITDNMDDLNDIGELLQLRKLGVILNCKKGSLSALFRQIEKLHGCLRSLSIRISKAPDTGPQATAMDTPPKRLCSLSSRINNRFEGKASAGDTGPQATAMETPPKHLQSLKISGITGGLPLWIAALDQLEEISLSETKLWEDAMNTLGNLRILRCLQLLQGSYNPSFLNFKASKFQQLRYLVVESGVAKINFEKGTTPKLRTIVWSFSNMEALSGLKRLTKLKKLELHGNFDLDAVERKIIRHPNNPVLEHSPRHQHQEDGTAAAEASSSSAP